MRGAWRCRRIGLDGMEEGGGGAEARLRDGVRGGRPCHGQSNWEDALGPMMGLWPVACAGGWLVWAIFLFTLEPIGAIESDFPKK